MKRIHGRKNRQTVAYWNMKEAEYRARGEGWKMRREALTTLTLALIAAPDVWLPVIARLIRLLLDLALRAS